MKKKSFTLLEMLIVLGIIAVILSVLSVSFAATQRKSRDAKRKGDIKALQNALEQYYSTCEYAYPTGLGSSIACGASPAIISVIPGDPKDGATPIYTPLDNYSSFSICTNALEAETPSSYCLYSQQ